MSLVDRSQEAQLEELHEDEACVGLHADNRVFLVTPRGQE